MRSTFFFKRAMVNFLRNRRNNFSSVINVAVVSFFSVLLLFIVENVLEFVDRLVSENSAAVILRDSATEEDIKKTGNFLSAQRVIEHSRYISPDEAYEELKKAFSLSSAAADIDPVKLLPHLYEIRFFRTVERKDYDRFREELGKIAAFKEMRVNSDLMELSFRIKKYSVYFKGIILLIVCISSFYILSNTIGLNLNNNRRGEIELIELLGGDSLDIKIPYIIEGMVVISIGFFLGVLIAYAGAAAVFPYARKVLDAGIFSYTPVMIDGKDTLLIYAILVMSGLFGVVRFINRFIRGLYEEESL